MLRGKAELEGRTPSTMCEGGWGLRARRRNGKGMMDSWLRMMEMMPCSIMVSIGSCHRS